MVKFEWDQHNIKHVSDDHPERENTREEVESIFSDPNLIIKTGTKMDAEQRYNAVGIGLSKKVRVVVFSVNNGYIRPISCWPANKQTIRFYYEGREKQ